MGWPRWSLETVLRSRPPVRINQLGYLPSGPKRGTLISANPIPMPFEVSDGTGTVVFRGRSAPWSGADPTSGMAVHVLDFTELRDEGSGLRLAVGGHRSHPFDVRPDLYRQLRSDALRFFLLMRSGAPIPDAAVPGSAVPGSAVPGYGRPAGHLGVAPNRGDTSVPAWTGPDAAETYPGWHHSGRQDVSGGWYDAGDYGKYVTSGAISVWQLLSALPLVTGTGAGDLATILVRECRWQLDWLLRMQVPDGELAGLAFHRVHGTTWPPVPVPPHHDPTDRVLHRPSTPAALHLAAVAAHGARLLGGHHPRYAKTLLAAAGRAYEAAHRHPELLPPDDHGRFGGGPYPDPDARDDFYWAAVELWLATGENRYRADFESSPEHRSDRFDAAGFDFDRVTPLARIDLALSGRHHDHQRAVVDGLLAADRLLDVQADQPWGQPYAPASGWDWGSNGRLLNNLVVIATAHLVSGDVRYRDAVLTGVDYLLGRNALGQSYITGYGTDDTRHQRTRQFGHDLDPAAPPPPPGALAGGANSRPHPDFPYDERLLGLPPQCCYLDEPTSEVTNDVCIRWNAPLVWIAIFLSGPARQERPAT
ncbi:MAG TPA: glycoside hydrolase family 9 protein [Microlunatus sp.]|nr:glycoside hydrolase family 9 protein [Microlunatus sp.]